MGIEKTGTAILRFPFFRDPPAKSPRRDRRTKGAFGKSLFSRNSDGAASKIRAAVFQKTACGLLAALGGVRPSPPEAKKYQNPFAQAVQDAKRSQYVVERVRPLANGRDVTN